MPKTLKAKKGPGIVTLLTDFGETDHFAGVMKGVIATLAPDARVIDITHGVGAQQIRQGRWLLAQSWKWFPAGTVHLVVVDPGVGSERRAIAVEALGHLFVGPDNGILSDLVTAPKAKVRQIANREWRLTEVSATFHGRDIFAPAAAKLASGARFASAGPLVTDAVWLGAGEPVRTGKRFWTGEIVHVDRFGNLITNLTPETVPGLTERPAVFRAGFRSVSGLSPNYAAGTPGEALALIGSHGAVEIAVNCGDAARALGMGLGAPIDVELL